MVRVNENYVIDVDENCYTVKFDTHRVDKKDEPIFTVIGYYGCLEKAIKCVIESMNKKELKDGIYSLEEALAILQENNKQFTQMLESAVQINGNQKNS